IGVTGYARFAGIAGWPALFPAFARTAWLNVAPEYNPFKYNSFPVNAARQSWLLTQALQAQIVQAARSGQISALAPVLTFQSVMDATVSTRAVVDALYHYLPRNGSSLVIFDINQAANMSALFRAPLPSAVSRLLPAAPRAYAATVITNRTPVTYQTEARTINAGEVEERVKPLTLAWPQDMFSLSHIAVPFPLNDDLYGEQPDEKNRYGISLGDISLRGETSSLTVGPETFMRATSNPFFSEMMARINTQIACSGAEDYRACIGR
ncbi:MAG: alpha/beta hydrolase, partial [Pantoea sp.]|nr:alpha/beta hydrolase [Pantoea sp.]